MDDYLIHSKFADHLDDLIHLFQSLIKNGLKISPHKCQFFSKSIVYMGLKFLIHEGRPSFTPMKDMCDAIRNLQPLKTVKDCRKVCGMVNFLATFFVKFTENIDTNIQFDHKTSNLSGLKNVRKHLMKSKQNSPIHPY